MVAKAASRDSSVGRAGDWKSPCPQFKSGSWHSLHLINTATLWSTACWLITSKLEQLAAWDWSALGQSLHQSSISGRRRPAWMVATSVISSITKCFLQSCDPLSSSSSSSDVIFLSRPPRVPLMAHLMMTSCSYVIKRTLKQPSCLSGKTASHSAHELQTPLQKQTAWLSSAYEQNVSGSESRKIRETTLAVNSTIQQAIKQAQSSNEQRITS